MRIKFIISYGAGENKYEPKYVCPICSQVGLAFDPAEKSLKSYSQSCLCCGYHDNPMHPEYKETWYDPWLECGAEKLYEKPYEERREYYSRIVYADYAKYRYVLSDEEIEKHEFDEKIFTQYGFVSNSDSSKKISVKSDDGRSWQFDYKTNTIFYLDDTEKFFAVGEEPDRGRYFLFASEDLTKQSSGDRRYRGGFIGFVPDLFGGYYSLDDECVLTDLEGKNYYFNLVQE